MNTVKTEIIDCHYCEYAWCSDEKSPLIRCCVEDDFEVKDSIKEAGRCSLFKFCDYFPKC